MDTRTLVDAELDKAQKYYEKGAYQVLQDGKWREEIAEAKAAFMKALSISKEAVSRLKELERKRVDAMEAKEKAEEEETMVAEHTRLQKVYQLRIELAI